MVVEVKLLGSDVAQAKRVTVRVRFDDGSSTEVTQKLGVSSALFSVGEIVPMRYDPADHSKMEIDLSAIEARQEVARQALAEMAIAAAEDELRAD